MSILITICARGGSKGIPGKNIKMLDGKPLIAYSIESAEKFAEHHEANITLSTDSDEIRTVARQFGLTTDYRRPEELASDTAGKTGTLKHVLLYEEAKREKKYDYVLDLDVTSPLRTLEDLTSAFERIERDAEALNLFSVSPANRNPYFNMVEQKKNGYYGLICQLDENITSRQTAPAVYDLNASFYFYKRAFFDASSPKTISEKSLIYIVPHICFDLDEAIDFEFLDFLLKNKKLNFKI